MTTQPLPSLTRRLHSLLPVFALRMLVAGLALLPLTVERAGAAEDRPNILFIFVDDLGWKDVGYQGSDFCETPRIDRLASEGMVFTNGYASGGNCMPSRACLLSGNYTPRHHVYAVNDTDRGPKALQRLIPIPNKSGLARDNVTMADALKAAGYATGHFGKWHLGGKDGAPPMQQGFDVSVPMPTATVAAAQANNNRAWQSEDPKGVFTLTDKACEFIETHREKPFFVYLAHHAVHTPLEARPETRAKFNAKTPGKQHRNPLYAACLYDLDESIGRLLDRVKELGLEEKTLVVFTSDNGGPTQSQEPLRGNKGCYYEGGVRDPFIVRWPGRVQAGSKCDVPVINIDLYPTFLAAAGTPVPAGKTLDGESLLPLLTQSGPLSRSSLFWHFPGYLNNAVTRGRDPVFRTRPVSVIRQGDWKLHLYHEEWQLDGGQDNIATNNAVELYNLAEDVGERNNLAQSHPQQRDKLLADLQKWFQSVDARLPAEKNPAYSPDSQTQSTGQQRPRRAARNN